MILISSSWRCFSSQSVSTSASGCAYWVSCIAIGKETSGCAHNRARDFTIRSPMKPHSPVEKPDSKLGSDFGQRGATVVKLLCNRGLHLPLHDLQLGKRALCFHFLEPFVEKCDLGALRHQFRKV